MIRRVKIQKYKSLKDVELHLRPISILVGPNASGKSNLLDALSLLSLSATQKNLSEAFKEHRGQPLETAYYNNDSNLNKNYDDITFEVDIELTQTVIDTVTNRIQQMRTPYEKDTKTQQKKYIYEHFMRYQISLRIDRKSGFIGVSKEMACAMRQDWSSPKSGRKAFIESDENHGKIYLRMEGQSHPTHFDIGLDHSILSTSFYEPHHPHLAALREELSRWKVFYFEPRELMREYNPIMDTSVIGSRGEYLASFYNSLKHKNPSQFKSIGHSLRQIIPDIYNIEVTPLPEGQVILEVQEIGGKRSARLISEGTLRLLGLAAIINSASVLSVIGYEEPENGVHPRRISLVAKWLKNAAANKNTQWIITTHSPQLAKEFDNQDLFVCSKDDSGSHFQQFVAPGELYRDLNIASSFEERLMRGDFGG